MKTESQKKVNLRLEEIDGNAFALMGAFARQAKREGWTEAEISAVREKCMSGDYDNLLRTLIAVCENRD